MSNSARNLNVMKLKLVVVLLQFISSSKARYVSDSALDLVASAAEPRPVVVEPPEELQAQVLPLIVEDYNIDASEKVEKILQKPLAFSYHNDEFPDSSSDEIGDEATIARVDQRPESTDYYKYVKNLEPIEDEEGAEEKNNDEEELVKHQGNENSESLEKTDSIEHHPYSFHRGDYSDNEDLDKNTKHNHRHKNIEYGDLDDYQKENSDKVELYDNTKQEKVADNIQQDTKHHDHKKSAGGGHGGSYKKGGGNEEHSGHKAEKGEKGDKNYKGHHHHEKGKKGHHTKEDHEKEYEEKGGKKHKHHHDDGYSAEHHKAEKGKKSSKYHEEGNHSKGHSTKGQHNIHKKDEFDKKQEFFDESYEEDGFEKDGEYFHESDYKKGGHEKGGHTKGGGEEAHYGKKHHYDKGGHYKEGKGHKEAAGHDAHYEHDNKKGEKESHSGGKKWTYDKGTGGGHKHGGKYQAANSVNVPVLVVPQHTDNVGQSNHPLRVFKERTSPIEGSKIMHRSVPGFNTAKEYDNYEDDGTVPIKHNKRIDESLILQRRNDEVYDNENEEEEPEADSPKESVSFFRSVISDDGFNREDSSEFDDELISTAAKNRDKLGTYSVYRLGDYTTKRPRRRDKDAEDKKPRLRLREETIIPQPLEETEVYEKPKHVAILTHTEAPGNENPDTVLPLQSTSNGAVTLSPLVDSTTQEISEFSHEDETTLASNISEEELTEDSEQYAEEESKILSSTMLPIIVKDESEEIDK